MWTQKCNFNFKTFSKQMQTKVATLKDAYVPLPPSLNSVAIVARQQILSQWVLVSTCESCLLLLSNKILPQEVQKLISEALNTTIQSMLQLFSTNEVEWSDLAANGLLCGRMIHNSTVKNDPTPHVSIQMLIYTPPAHPPITDPQWDTGSRFTPLTSRHIQNPKRGTQATMMYTQTC